MRRPGRCAALSTCRGVVAYALAVGFWPGALVVGPVAVVVAARAIARVPRYWKLMPLLGLVLALLAIAGAIANAWSANHGET